MENIFHDTIKLPIHRSTDFSPTFFLWMEMKFHVSMLCAVDDALPRPKNPSLEQHKTFFCKVSLRHFPLKASREKIRNSHFHRIMGRSSSRIQTREPPTTWNANWWKFYQGTLWESQKRKRMKKKCCTTFFFVFILPYLPNVKTFPSQQLRQREPGRGKKSDYRKEIVKLWMSN